MEIIRDYEEVLSMAMPHPMESVMGRLVTKGIVPEEAARRFLLETK